jgi:ribulose bisphosphate carboxylase small subunit
MVSATYANNKKACCVDPISRKVEVVSKGFKVAVEFLSDGRVEVISFNQDGTIADKQYIAAPA